MIKPAKIIYGPVCGVFAVFLAGPAPEFEPVFKDAKETLSRSDRWGGRTRWSEVKHLLTSIGIKFGVWELSVGKTVQRAIKDGDFVSSHQYVVWINGHFLTIKGILCYDQAHPEGAHYAAYFARRSRIKDAIKIL